jgi:hypothetical protein
MTTWDQGEMDGCKRRTKDGWVQTQKELIEEGACMICRHPLSKADSDKRNFSCCPSLLSLVAGSSSFLAALFPSGNSALPAAARPRRWSSLGSWRCPMCPASASRLSLLETESRNQSSLSMCYSFDYLVGSLLRYPERNLQRSCNP